jgi:hypothetical protein
VGELAVMAKHYDYSFIEREALSNEFKGLCVHGHADSLDCEWCQYAEKIRKLMFELFDSEEKAKGV